MISLLHAVVLQLCKPLQGNTRSLQLCSTKFLSLQFIHGIDGDRFQLFYCGFIYTFAAVQAHYATDGREKLSLIHI